MRKLAMIAAVMASAFAGPSVAYSLRNSPSPGEGMFLSPKLGRQRQARGRHKLPRHGQKLKSCRVKIGRRVRRKHRRAA